jgi:hypothetical protein
MHIASNWLSTGSQRFSSIAGAINRQPAQLPLTITRLCAATGELVRMAVCRTRGEVNASATLPQAAAIPPQVTSHGSATFHRDAA